jgi:hypothetical protein
MEMFISAFLGGQSGRSRNQTPTIQIGLTTQVTPQVRQRTPARCFFSKRHLKTFPPQLTPSAGILRNIGTTRYPPFGGLSISPVGFALVTPFNDMFFQDAVAAVDAALAKQVVIVPAGILVGSYRLKLLARFKRCLPNSGSGRQNDACDRREEAALALTPLGILKLWSRPPSGG